MLQLQRTAELLAVATAEPAQLSRQRKGTQTMHLRNRNRCWTGH
jgi:hypothetical protein